MIWKIRDFLKGIRENRRLDRILKSGGSILFSDNESDHKGELSIDELKFLGWGKNFPKKSSREILYEALEEEYKHLKRVHSVDLANLAISVIYSHKSKSSVYQKFIKHRDGRWYTLNSFFMIEEAYIYPTDSNNWLLFCA